MAQLKRCIFTLSILFQISVAEPIAPLAEASRNAFATDLFKVIASLKPDQNVVYSAVSIHSCLTLAFIGAADQTAEELRYALKLGDGDKEQIGKDYGDFLSSEFKASAKPDDLILRMANRIYVHKGLKIAVKFNEISKNYFGSETEEIDFADSAAATKKINNWVAKLTANKIDNVLKDDAVNGDTSVMLINAIYFKAKWATPFRPEATYNTDFHLNAWQKTKVDMMRQRGKFPYGDLTDFDVKAIELAYKNSDMSMLIILPNKVDGLQALERKLSSIDLNEISKRLEVFDVVVQLPKFKIEFNVDLKEPLQKLGIRELFSDNANLSDLFTNRAQQMKVTAAIHKAYLDVNEESSEAAAATAIAATPVSGPKKFHANHPFVFAIRNNSTILFAGHVAKF